MTKESNAKILIHDPQGEKREERLVANKPLVALGRDPANDIVLSDISISRRHAELKLVNGDWFIRDLASRNGVYLQTAKIPAHTDCKIASGDLMEWGAYKVKFELERAPVTNETPSTIAVNLESDVNELRDHVLTKNQAVSWGPGSIVLVAFVFIMILGGVFFRHTESKKSKAEIKHDPQQQIQTPEPSLARKPVFLQVTAEPFSGEIYFNGQSLGVTPFSDTILAPKNFELDIEFLLPEINEKLRLKRFLTQTEDDSPLFLRIQPPLGRFLIASLPQEIDFHLKGAYTLPGEEARIVDLSNLVFGRSVYLPFGTYTLELTTKNNPQKVVWRRNWEFLEGHSEELFQEIDLLNYPAHITSEPNEAEVLLDGKSLGLTPFSGVLPLGLHQLEYQKKGFTSQKIDYNKQVSEPENLFVQLLVSSSAPLKEKALTLVQEQKWTELKTLLQDDQNLTQDADFVQYHLGLACLKLNQFSESEAWFLKASEAKDYFVRAKAQRAMALFNLGLVEQAMQAIVEASLNLTEKSITTDKELVRAVFREISPVKGVLYIQSQPSHAKVFVNNQLMQQSTPLILSDLGVTNYLIRIEKEGYKNDTKNQPMKAGDFYRLEFELKKEN